MMSCHHATAGDGRQEFVDWCTSDPEFSDQAWIVGRRWDSLHLKSAANGNRPVTVKYLHKVLSEAGSSVAIAKAAEEFVPLPKAESGTLESDFIEDMNNKHAVVMEGGKFRIFTEERDPMLNRQFYQRSSREDMENLYANSVVELGGKIVTKATAWLRHPRRKQYKGILFDPSRNYEGWLNLWRGWAVEPKQGDWSLMQRLISEVLTDGNPRHEKYVLDWLAHMVQRPHLAAEVALVFRGDKGTGKGTLGRAASALAGTHGLHVSAPEHLTGRFNSHLQNCICLFADEAFWAGDKAGESRLKQLVTEPTLAYEGKGRDTVSGKNLIHIIIASNADWVVPAGLDRERRFAVFTANAKLVDDMAFFKALNAQMYGLDSDGEPEDSNPNGLSAMLYDLLKRDITDWAPRDNIPATDALLEQKLNSMDDVEAWWYGILMNHILPHPHGNWLEGPVNVVKSHLRASYAEYAKEQRAYRPADDREFGVRLKKLVSYSGKQIKPHGDETNIQVDVYGRATAYVLPSLIECRRQFEVKLGHTPKWENYDN